MEEENNLNSKDTQNTFLKGSAWMTFGSIASRILGALYIIPWYAWMGSYGNIANALTARSYNIYTIFILISTAGIPGAIAKQVAKYNALNEYGIGRKLFRKGLILMSILGIVSAAIMYFASPLLASNGSQSDPRQVAVMRSLSYAILIIPILSIMRGYFQGYADMMPSAMSQFVEQFARVVWMLLTAFVIMQIQHGSYVHAVIQSNLAAAIGALFGIGLLIWFLFSRRNQLNYLVEHSNNRIHVSTTELFMEIIEQAIPFIIIDSGITLFSLVDQYTFHPMIASLVHASSDTIEDWYALFGLNANKLIMIIVSLASAMAVTAIPLLSAAHTRGDYKSISKQIANTMDLFLFVMIPAAFGMAAISRPIYTVFYGPDLLGSNVLYLSSFTAISLGLFTVLMAILQGLSENGLAIKYLVLGLILKGILQYPMIFLFKVYGPLVATNLGLLIIVALSLKHLEVQYDFNLNRTSRRLAGVTAFSIGMFLVVKLCEMGLGKFLNPDHRFTALVLVIVAVGAGIVFYGLVTLKTGLAQSVLGSKVESILVRLHMDK
ncbi:polysaccharide biosynthesis protein [Lactobacillus crispatus]|jgi:O-antigen/teichoic acid export membrane protein|uniref:Polysaccharide biosynthesis protein n=1 Tax=Lactobacillus crispatus TaxID=47770 RepID=A0A2N5KZ48_9LACO|nr:polysaccharide biosynthesis protein [Lactobacillus crispatus]EEU20354.1 polysaccharide biosynthesis protein [Lactobacillus crispatus 125-2-CHN]KAA8812247.1 polysaccharide biosynthesis protein [Lactobacillus crispatus]KRK33459.1 polysaccharide transporter [Lactobacillus crispatus DSM 20584 = JCM 1185 = ATCC 33820]MBG0731585.1 polysaccharide biosynthesis protein [Lactobacillus crispatus]MBW9143452.1 polysaccharide biosynthesis protein [Lactobacillus crispatus]